MFSIEQLLRRLECMPMLKLLVPFAAGILLAECFTLPLWFTAGAFVLCGVVALLLRAAPALVGMLCAAGFGTPCANGCVSMPIRRCISPAASASYAAPRSATSGAVRRATAA